MKRYILSVFLLLIWGLAGAERITFSANYTTGELAAGKSVGKGGPLVVDDVKTTSAGASGFTAKRSILLYSAEGNFVPAQGSFSCRYTPAFDPASSDAPGEITLFQAGNGWIDNNAGIMMLSYRSKNKTFRFGISTAVRKTVNVFSPAIPLVPGKSYLLKAVWYGLDGSGDGKLTLSVDGRVVAEGKVPAHKFPQPVTFGIGNSLLRDYGHQSRGSFSEVQLTGLFDGSGTGRTDTEKSSAGDPVLFYASFDQSYTAGKAGGNGTPVLRHGTVLVPMENGAAAGGFSDVRSILSYEAAGNFSPANGSFSCAFTPDSDPAGTKTEITLFQAGNGWLYNDPAVMMLSYDYNRKRFSFGVSRGKRLVSRILSTPHLLKKGEKTEVAVNWQGLDRSDGKCSLEIFINGRPAGKQTFPAFVFPMPEKFYIGNTSLRNYDHQARGSFDYIRLTAGPAVFGVSPSGAAKGADCHTFIRKNTGRKFGKVLFVPRSTNRIDGSAAEWRDLRPFEGNGIIGKYGFAWDNDFLYCVIKTDDTVHRQTQRDDKAWLEDSLQLALDPFNAKTGGSYGEHDFEFCFFLKDGKVGRSVSRSPVMERLDKGAAAVDPAQIRCAVSREGKTTVYELAIPWQTTLLRRNPPQPGEAVGLNFLINDDNGSEGRRFFEWTEGTGVFKSPALFHTLVMYDNSVPARYRRVSGPDGPVLRMTEICYNPGVPRSVQVAFALNDVMKRQLTATLGSDEIIFAAMELHENDLPGGENRMEMDVTLSGCSSVPLAINRTRRDETEYRKEFCTLFTELEKQSAKRVEPQTLRAFWHTMIRYHLERIKKEFSASPQHPPRFYLEQISDLQGMLERLKNTPAELLDLKIRKISPKKLTVRNGNFYHNSEPVVLVGPIFDEKGNLSAVRRHLDLAADSGFDALDFTDTVSLSSILNDDAALNRAAWKNYMHRYRTIAAEDRLAIFMNPNTCYTRMAFYKDTSLCGGKPFSGKRIWGNGNYPVFHELCGGHFLAFDLSADSTKKLFRNFFTAFLPEWSSLKTFKCLWLTNEVDYRASNQLHTQKYRLYLQEKYKNIKTLNRFWQSSYKSFAEIRPDKDRHAPGYYDTITFLQTRLGDVYRELCALSRRMDPASYLSNKPQAFTLLDPEKGQDFELQAELLDIPAFDGGFPSDCYMLNTAWNGLLALDFFRSKAPGKPNANLEFHNAATAEKRNDFADAAAFQSAFHGMRYLQFWLWVGKVRSNDHRNTFLTTSGTFSLDMLAVYHRLRAAEKEIACFPAVPQTAIYYGKASLYRHFAYAGLFQKIHSALLGMQLPIGIITDRMIAEGKAVNYRAIIIPEAPFVPEDTFRKLKEYTANGGKLILTGRKNFAFNEYGIPRESAGIGGKTLLLPTELPQCRAMLEQELQRSGIRRELFFEIVSGRNANGLDSQCVTAPDGRKLVFAVNMNNEPVTLRLKSAKPFQKAVELTAYPRKIYRSKAEFTLPPGGVALLEVYN